MALLRSEYPIDKRKGKIIDTPKKLVEDEEDTTIYYADQLPSGSQDDDPVDFHIGAVKVRLDEVASTPEKGIIVNPPSGTELPPYYKIVNLNDGLTYLGEASYAPDGANHETIVWFRKGAIDVDPR